MKKTTKFLAIILTSLTTLTGCKGKEVTHEEALNVIDDIIAKQELVYKENTSFTMESLATGTVDGQRARTKSKVKYDAENNMVYAYLLDGEDEEEVYMGLKDGSLYTVDVVAKEYSVISFGAEELWSASKKVYENIPYVLASAVLAEAKLAASTNDEDYKFFSSSDGNLVIEATNLEETDGDDSAAGDVTYTIKDYLITKEVANESGVSDGQEYETQSKTTVKYSASVKLPSLDGYTKK